MGNIILIIVMVAALIALVVGVVLMAMGGKMNAKYSNKLMVWRVALQAGALAILAALFFAKG